MFIFVISNSNALELPLDLQPHEQSLFTELRSREPLWKGPLVDGITQSLLNEFLQDPFSAYLSLILGLEPPRDDPPYDQEHPRFNLHWGDAYHVGLEHLIKTGDISYAQQQMLYYYDDGPQLTHPDINVRTSLFFMLKQYNLNVPHESTTEWDTEVVFDTTYLQSNCPEFRLRGKFDGLSKCGTYLVEHKCKKRIDPIQLAEEIYSDTQLNMYLGISGARQVYYDLIRIPESTYKYSLPGRSGMDAKAYTNKLYFGDCGNYSSLPISKYTHDWISQQLYTFTEEQVDRFWQTTLIPLFKRLLEWYEYVTDPNFDPCNPECYGPIFYIHPLRTFIPAVTETFKCKFHSLLTRQTELGDLDHKPSLFEELQ